MFYFMKRSSVTCGYIIFCYFVFFLILQEMSMYPQSHLSMQLTAVSNGSQLLLSKSLLFCFKPENGFLLGICEVGRLKKKPLSHGN